MSLSSDYFQLVAGLQFCNTYSYLPSLLLITSLPPICRVAPKEKTKNQSAEESIATPTRLNLDHILLVDSLFKIAEAKCEFDFYELHLSLKQNYLEKQDPIRFWESLIPFFCFPKTHEFPNLITYCQAKYDPVKREVMAQNGDILITIFLKPSIKCS